MNAKTEKLVPIRYVMLGIGHESYGKFDTDKIFKKHKPEILAEMPWGKGTMQMIRKTDADKIIALEKLDADEDVNENSSTVLHIGAIETKLDRVEAEIKGLHQAMGEFTKASNLIADRLNKVLQQLGVS